MQRRKQELGQHAFEQICHQLYKLIGAVNPTMAGTRLFYSKRDANEAAIFVDGYWLQKQARK